jgi:hypothetical protein
MADTGTWLSLRDAGTALSLSAHSVRRRMKSGLLRAQRRRTAQGPRTFVWVPDASEARAALAGAADDSAHTAPSAPTAHSAPDAGSAHTAQESAAPAEGASTALAVARATEMAAFTEQLLKPWREQVAERCGRLEAELEAARRPWWKFW